MWTRRPALVRVDVPRYQCGRPRCRLWRPDASGKFPVVVCFEPASASDATAEQDAATWPYLLQRCRRRARGSRGIGDSQGVPPVTSTRTSKLTMLPLWSRN